MSNMHLMGQNNTQFLLPTENTLINYGKTKTQLCLTNKEAIVDLSKRLDNHFELVIAKEVSKDTQN